uniref:Uncharacterized protein n=1 Tax=Arundo donax TaxID=35708 RepID=A0A0A9EHT4_ARUDO
MMEMINPMTLQTLTKLQRTRNQELELVMRTSKGRKEKQIGAIGLEAS